MPYEQAGRLESAQLLESVYAHISEMHDPSLAIYGLARLGAATCAVDKSAGSKLIQEVHKRVIDLSRDAFDSSEAPLAASSFTALQKEVLESARACGIGEEIVNDRAINSRMSFEWSKANVWLRAALKSKDANRAAQLAEAALYVSNHSNQLHLRALQYNVVYEEPQGRTRSVLLVIRPDILDLKLFVEVLGKLRKEAPGLADRVFQKAVQTIKAASPPTAAEFAQLAVYLFPTSRRIQLPVDSRIVVDPPGGLSIPNLVGADLEGTFAVAVAFLRDATEVIESYRTREADALDVYAFAYEMLPTVEKYAPELLASWRTAAMDPEIRLGTTASKIQDDFGPLPHGSSHEKAATDFVTAGQALVELETGYFEGAHARVSRIGDESAHASLDKLVKFEEIAQSLLRKGEDPVRVGSIYPDGGARRVLLYASVLARTVDRNGSLRILQDAIDELTPLPAVERSCILPGLVTSASALDEGLAVAMLRLLIKADNEMIAATQGGSDAVVPTNGRCDRAGFEEYLDLQEGKLAFILQVPGISGYSLQSALQSVQSHMKTMDLLGLVRVVLDLRNELHLLEALLTLAEKEAGHHP